MASIKLTDTSAAEATIDLSSTVADFGKSPATAVRFAENDVLEMSEVTIDQVPLGQLTFGFDYSPSFNLGATSKFIVGGDLKASFSIWRMPLHPESEAADPALFPGDPLGDDPISLHDVCYTQMQFITIVEQGASAAPPPYTIDQGASVQASASMYLPYSKNQGYPNLKQALTDAFSKYSIPTTRAELGTLQEGSIFVYAATGSLRASGKFNLLTAINPTASTAICDIYGPFSFNAGPEVTLGGCITFTSDFEIRIRKLDANTLRIGHHRKQGASLTITFDAGADIDATAGGFDLIAAMYGLLGSNAKVSKGWFKDHGADGLGDDIQDALQAAVQQKLSIALDAATDATASDSTAFLFEFDLSKLDAQGQRALDALLRGDLSQLIMGAGPPKGITQRTNIIERIRSTGHTLSVNFLGVFSYADVEKFALESTAKYTERGEIAFMDKATASDIAVTAAPFLTSQKLHHVLADLFTVTASYSCALGSSAPAMVATQQFYDFEKKIDHATLAWFLDVARQLGSPLNVPDGPYGGNGWIDARLAYDNNHAMLLFLDASGNARAQADFVTVGRRAMVASVRAYPAVAYLQYMEEHQPYWDAIVGRDPGLSWPMTDLQKRQFGMACSAVLSWAHAMAKASALLQQLIAYANAHGGPRLSTDLNFLDLRRKLAGQLKQATSKLVGGWVPGWSTFAVYYSQKPSSVTVKLNFLRQSFTLPGSSL